MAGATLERRKSAGAAFHPAEIHMHGTIRKGPTDFGTETDDGADCVPICGRAVGARRALLPVTSAPAEQVRALVGTVAAGELAADRRRAFGRVPPAVLAGTRDRVGNVAERTGSAATDGGRVGTTDGDVGGWRASEADAPTRGGDHR